MTASTQESPAVLKGLLCLGLLAAIIVGLGEWMLHYLPGGKLDEMDMLNHVPLDRAGKGHFLVVFGAPLYLAGYYALWRMFRPGSPLAALFLFCFGSMAFMVGGVWVGSRYFAAEVLQRTAGTPDYDYFLQMYEGHYQVLVQALRLIILGVTVFYVICVWKNNFGMPRWLVAANPIVLLALVISSILWLPPLGEHLMPIAMNVVHFVFFGLVLLFFWRGGRAGDRDAVAAA